MKAACVEPTCVGPARVAAWEVGCIEPGKEPSMEPSQGTEPNVEDGTRGADSQVGNRVATGVTYCRQDLPTFETRGPVASEMQDPATYPIHLHILNRMSIPDLELQLAQLVLAAALTQAPEMPVF